MKLGRSGWVGLGCQWRLISAALFLLEHLQEKSNRLEKLAMTFSVELSL